MIADTEITHLCDIVVNSVRKSNFKMVPAQIKKVGEYVRGKEYPKPSEAKMDEAQNEEEILLKKA